ncbi:MAG: flagellar biosynthesis regulator FlaF [Rhodospirillales bacterium]|nr:flagellar biosynthesis regulator FlaF [Rhodospirillales bacterium]
MNKKDLVKNYETPPPLGNPREIEAWGLTQAALKLKTAVDDGDPEVIRAAIRINWQLWTILQGELLDPECPLPDDIRANAISLSNFVDKQSLDLIASPITSKIDILISINRELAAGLRTKPSNGNDAAEAADDQQPPPLGDLSA